MDKYNKPICIYESVYSFVIICRRKVNDDYITLFGISPSKVYKKLKELGYKISDFEWNKKFVLILQFM